MRVISLIVLFAFTLVSRAAAAPQSQVSPPFSKLFRSPTTPLSKPSAPVAAPDAKSLSKLMLQGRQPTTIVCGMTMVPVDSSIDPKIERQVPSTGTKFTIKIARPPMCGQ